jgi:hypothetical protein
MFHIISAAEELNCCIVQCVELQISLVSETAFISFAFAFVLLVNMQELDRRSLMKLLNVTVSPK